MALIDTILQKGYSSYQKNYLIKMAPNINGASQKWHLTKMVSHENNMSQNWHLKTYIIGFLKYYQHPTNKTNPYN